MDPITGSDIYIELVCVTVWILVWKMHPTADIILTHRTDNVNSPQEHSLYWIQAVYFYIKLSKFRRNHFNIKAKYFVLLSCIILRYWGIELGCAHVILHVSSEQHRRKSSMKIPVAAVSFLLTTPPPINLWFFTVIFIGTWGQLMQDVSGCLRAL